MYKAESCRYLLLEDLKRFCFKHSLMAEASLVQWKRLNSYIELEVYGERIIKSNLSDVQLLEIVRLALDYSGISHPSITVIEEYVNVLDSYCTKRIVVQGE